MNSNSRLIRSSDKKIFVVSALSHWSEIRSVEEPAEYDFVKWLGGDKYISSDKGNHYTLENNNE